MCAVRVCACQRTEPLSLLFPDSLLLGLLVVLLLELVGGRAVLHLGGVGREHHQSSENGVKPGYFTEWARTEAGRDARAKTADG